MKERAVDAELEDESIFDFEGLFELGSEDAYSQRAYIPERLHDHIERTKDECWRLQVVRVINSQQKQLGWSLCVVLYPALPYEAPEAAIEAAEIAEILELNHYHTYTEAVLAVNGMLQFMLEDGRVEEPDYASMNDSEVFELMSVQCSVEGIIAPEWEVLEAAALRRFLDGTQALVRSAKYWHPRQGDSVAQVAEIMNIPLHIADQLYAQMLEAMEMSEPLDKDNPWCMLNGTD